MADCNHPSCNAVEEATKWLIKQAQDETSYLGSWVRILAEDGHYGLTESLFMILQEASIALLDIEALRELEGFRHNARNN